SSPGPSRDFSRPHHPEEQPELPFWPGNRGPRGRPTMRCSMPLGLLGLKVGMTQVFDDKGMLHPVTVINLGPCPILQIRTQDRDGYDAVQLGFKDKSRKRASRAEAGHVAQKLESKTRKKKQEAGETILPKADCEPQKFIREFRIEKASELTVGTV